MSYIKTTWQDGDVITTEKLNKIEDGIENATSGSGGESGSSWEPRFIDYDNLPAATDFPSQWAKQYEVGLEPSDFYGAYIDGNAVFGVGGSNDSESGSYFEIGFLEFDSIYAPRNGIFLYYPELGVIDGPEFLD